MTRRGALILIAGAALAGCGGEEERGYEAAANALQAERNNQMECHDCPLELGNGVTAPMS